MRCLLLGSGGRESALASGLSRSRALDELVAAPGNPGIARVASTVALDPSDPGAVIELARGVEADLIVVGPEAPLVAGVADALRSGGRRVFGPDAAAARIEGSKAHAKRLMDAAGIPTAGGRSFTSPPEAIAFMDWLGPPFVIKADGLAAGKGVVVTSDRTEAVDAIEDRLVRGSFGDAGRTILVEEYLDGPEASLIAFVDGRQALACEVAQDFKRARDRDEGPNTGGMGSYSPVPACPADLSEQLVADVIEPLVAATAERGAPFVGALYAGLALTGRGPRVIEFNARFGDPETQALLPRLESDLGELCLACAEGELEGHKLQWTPRACVAVVLASGGYPGSFDIGFPLDGLDDAAALDGVEVFHAGTAARDGVIVTAGGRVVAVSALGDDLGDARARAYEAAGLITFQDKHVRADIALDAARAQGGQT